MKKEYEKPTMEVTEFRFSEHIAASGCTSEYSQLWGQSGCEYLGQNN